MHGRSMVAIYLSFVFTRLFHHLRAPKRDGTFELRRLDGRRLSAV